MRVEPKHLDCGSAAQTVDPHVQDGGADILGIFFGFTFAQR